MMHTNCHIWSLLPSLLVEGRKMLSYKGWQLGKISFLLRVMDHTLINHLRAVFHYFHNNLLRNSLWLIVFLY